MKISIPKTRTTHFNQSNAVKTGDVTARLWRHDVDRWLRWRHRAQVLNVTGKSIECIRKEGAKMQKNNALTGWMKRCDEMRQKCPVCHEFVSSSKLCDFVVCQSQRQRSEKHDKNYTRPAQKCMAWHGGLVYENPSRMQARPTHTPPPTVTLLVKLH